MKGVNQNLYAQLTKILMILDSWIYIQLDANHVKY